MVHLLSEPQAGRTALLFGDPGGKLAFGVPACSEWGQLAVFNKFDVYGGDTPATAKPKGFRQFLSGPNHGALGHFNGASNNHLDFTT